MAYKSPYRPYSFDQSDRKTLTITNFGGVDLTSQKFNVSSSRAIQSLNFIYRDGMIQKRYGYEQVYYVKQKSFTNEKGVVVSNSNNFNGIWKFIAEDKKEHIIAHIGKVLYEITNIGNENINFKMLCLECFENKTYELLDQNSFAFVSGNKLWILGGISYLCVRFIDGVARNIYKVDETLDLCFIPTTTYSILETYAIAEDLSYTRVNYQPVNLLTKWRKNACVTGNSRKSESEYASKFYEWQLDAPIVWENESDMNNFSITIETLGD